MSGPASSSVAAAAQRTSALPAAASLLGCIGRTPLVPLTRIGMGLPVQILAKCEHLNPGGSVKDRLALALIRDGEARGLLRPGMTLIEATAGNTGVGLALAAAGAGYALVCVLPEKMSADKRTTLAALGAELVIAPNAPPSDPRNFQNLARRLAQERGWFLTEQFTNPANIAIHEAATGPEVWEQSQGRIGAFVAGVGTGGTLSGVGRFLKRMNPRIRVILADPVGSRLAHLVDPRLPDLDAAYAVEGIGGSVAPANLDLTVVDAAEQVTDEESFAIARRLWREEGLLVGGSSGTTVAAALRTAARGVAEGPIVALLGDSWDRYFSRPWFSRPE